MVSITLRSLSFVIANLIVSAPGAISQDLSGLPPCALSCSETAYNAINRACTQTDFACLCKNHDFVQASSSCYASSCPADQHPKAVEFGIKTCAQVGVNITASAVATAASGVANVTAGVVNATANAANATANAATNVAGALGRAANSTTNSPVISNGSASANRQNSAGNTVAFSMGTLGLFFGTAVVSLLVSS